ncbi:MAG: HflC protein [Alteromonadaceae bacterium]|nr:MAG: HflC protein [Alteromonadaceae bacterium]
MTPKLLVSAIVVFVIALVAANTLYVVNEFERAVRLQFNRVLDNDIEPGLHYKWPFIDTVLKFDARVLTLDARPERYFTEEKKIMMVDSFVKWRIIDVGKYYKKTNGEEASAKRLLAPRISEGLRNRFALYSLQDVVSGERDELLADITQQLNEFSQESLGIEVIDVRVKKIDLPDEVRGPVFKRMMAERAREAREHRSKGIEAAEKIRAEAERLSTIIEAEAYRDSELLRGEGDAKAAAIYAEAYNKDPEFYAFVRSLNAYKKTFSDRRDVLLLDPDSDFFRYLNSAKGE